MKNNNIVICGTDNLVGSAIVFDYCVSLVIWISLQIDVGLHSFHVQFEENKKVFSLINDMLVNDENN